MIEFQILKQILLDLEDKLKTDLENVSIEANSITWRKYYTDDTVEEGTAHIQDLSKYSEMAVWLTDHCAPNRFEKSIHIKVRTVRGDSSAIEIKLKKIDEYRYSVLKFKYMLYKIKRLKVKLNCLDFDKKLADVNSDRIDKILLGGDSTCQRTSKNESKPSGNILPAGAQSKK